MYNQQGTCTYTEVRTLDGTVVLHLLAPEREVELVLILQESILLKTQTNKTHNHNSCTAHSRYMHMHSY
jgi:hypothetical protein